VRTLREAGCVFAEQEARLLRDAAASDAELATMVERRIAGLPVEYVVGWTEFCDLRIAVEPGVFVPRRRTELLARQAAARVRPGAVVVDLCCGSGAIAAVIIAATPNVELHAVDIELSAVMCARANLPSGRVYRGDLYEPLPATLRGRVEIVVANVPYVPTDAIPLLPTEAREHEPHAALDGGADGLDIQRRVIKGAGSWLAPDGSVLLETSEQQAPQTVAAFEASGMTAEVVECEALSATIVIGRLD
ncbi:MAG: putative protein N(5)-glutamine methyltransferase, partial [Chloroflexi bacterium]|nr:putative protein N(5)-glutamine methyltransferase [Chloroflexota bacterium]